MYAVQKGMSALPPKANICSATRYVRFVPIADIGTNLVCQLFDHFVGTGEQRGRHGKAERLSSFEIDHQFVLGRGLHWKVGRLLTL
jgi:hypothetical protein